MRLAALAGLLLACGPIADPTRSDAGPPEASVPKPPMLPDPEPSGGAPCEREAVIWVGKASRTIVLPCRPYDPKRDAPYPLP